MNLHTDNVHRVTDRHSDVVDFIVTAGISFVRSGTTKEEQGPSATANPDEIHIDADYSSDEESDNDSGDEDGGDKPKTSAEVSLSNECLHFSVATNCKHAMQSVDHSFHVCKL